MNKRGQVQENHRFVWATFTDWFRHHELLHRLLAAIDAQAPEAYEDETGLHIAPRLIDGCDSQSVRQE